MQPTTSVPLLLALGPQQHQRSAINQYEQEEVVVAPSTNQQRSYQRIQQQQQQAATTTRREKKSQRKQSNNRLLLRSVRGSKLVENFSEFLASRNVINSYSRYNKIVNDAPIEPAHSDGGTAANDAGGGGELPFSRQQQRVDFRCDKRLPNFFLKRQETHKDHHQHKPSRVILLVGALFSRKQRNKASVLAELLRTPIVLAALFSLILVATLLTLYTHMSFHHTISSIYPSHELLANVTPAPAPAATDTNHHINSRHLQQQQQQQQQRLQDGSSSESLANEMNEQPEVASSGFDRALTVQTECGSFVGSPEQTALAFLGIPYASPPVKERRWSRPRPVWLDERLCRRNQTRLASQRRSHCAQLSPLEHRFSGHEDCLYLDIWAPQLDQVQKLPVMVYIHGGFLAYGSSGQGRVNWVKAQPSGQLASELNVVLVTFNYRLQALGFMTLLQLAQNNGPDGSEGNYGLWDQLMALNWIKRNIESFGGNPDNIVLFGPDSASALPLALLTNSDTGSSAAADHQSPLSRLEPPAAEKELVAQDGQDSKKQERESISEATTSTFSKEAPKRLEEKWIHSRDLFRAVWLTNPTVYYERPYEVANRHYQRLFLDQSPCRLTSAGGDLRPPAALALAPAPTTNSSNKPVPPGDSDKSLADWRQPSGSTESLDIGLVAHLSHTNSKKQQSGELLLLSPPIECLMNLTAEQVVRHYLRQDDPSYRLDDQNSLPIHGVLVDQFVTIDRELVQDSYPFLRRQRRLQPPPPPPKAVANLNPSSPNPPQTPEASGATLAPPPPQLVSSLNHRSSVESHYATTTTTTTTTTSSRLVVANESTLPPPSLPQPQLTSEGSVAGGAGRRYNDDYDDDDDNCVGPICAASQGGASSSGGKDLLLGSTAQAVEYWPCPRDLHQWTWEDFKRYVNISLNSFIADTYRRASELYGVPVVVVANDSDTSASGPTRSPIETYLTMVSDIRQICPINELADNLRTAAGSHHHRVHRYIVETRPTGRWRRRSRQTVVGSENTTPSGSLLAAGQLSEAKKPQQEAHAVKEEEEPQEPQHLRPEPPSYAFHNWDLMAFFGFEFEPNYLPSEADLKFQSHIRRMVRKFVHRESPKRIQIEKLPSDREVSQFTLFGQGSTKTRIQWGGHKAEECRMWRRHLGSGYAWVS